MNLADLILEARICLARRRLMAERSGNDTEIFRLVRQVRALIERRRPQVTELLEKRRLDRCRAA